MFSSSIGSSLTLLALTSSSWALLGCGSTDEPLRDDGFGTAEGAATICSSRVVGQRRNGTPIEDRELYYFEHINSRLERYPELASATGLASVETCADARHFSREYRAYKEHHPDFNDVAPDQSYWEWLEEGAGQAQVAQAGGSADVAKIWQGAPGIELGVVELELAGGVTCTASFIADRWLLTSASCIVLPDPQSKFAFEDVIVWQLDRDGTPVRVGGSSVPTAWYPYDGFFGSPNHENNLALVHIYPEFEGDLYEARDAALPLARQSFAAGSTVEPWGWGQFEESTTLPDVLLGPPLDANGERAGIALSGSAHQQAIKNEYFAIPVGLSTPRICQGDEGGPLLEDVTRAGDLRPKRIIHGVAVDFVGDHCATQGTLQYWARIDTPEKLSWVERVLRNREHHRNSLFECERVERGTGDINQSYSECWAPYCTEATKNTDCIYGDSCVSLFGPDRARRCAQWL